MTEVNYEKMWEDVLKNIRVSVSPAIFATWFTQTHLTNLKINADRAICEVGCHSSFVKNTLESRYFGLIQDTISNYLNLPSDVLFVVKELTTTKAVEETPLFSTDNSSQQEVNDAALKAYLRPALTFENFAVSSSNQMAWAAAEAVSKNLGSAYNPLFIWGGVGVGKTHLMNAVGLNALKNNSRESVLFCTGEQFTNDIVEGIRNKSTQAVRNKYRKLRILMIDDIQFIAGKDTVQEEFFHTFNALVSAKSQVILTSDRPPSEIAKLEERLRSRFEAGLIVDIAPPDFELRCAIAQIKATEKNLDIPMDLIQIIAGNLESARKIEGALVRLSSEVHFKKSQITQDLIEGIIGKSIQTNGSNTKIAPEQFIEAVIKYYSIKKRDLMGTSRARQLARPRQILMYLLRMETRLALEEVGRLIGGRDHTTVMHAVDKITTLASTDVKIREDIQGIKGCL